MNSRDYKEFKSGHWYHVYNRGHNKDLVFLDRQDYIVFTQRLAHILSVEPLIQKSTLKRLPKDAFIIMAYCLMPNHYHFLIKQNSELSIAILMQRLGTSYAKYFNARYNRVGSIFQDTFKAKLVDNDSYLTYLSAYIHNNPESPFEYEFSSIHEYLDVKNIKFCVASILLKYFDSYISKYKNFLEGYTFKQHQLIRELTFED